MLHSLGLCSVMKFYYYKDYETMSEASAELMAQTVKQNPKANLCLASGGSPERTYSLFVEKLKNLDYAKMTLTKLDEWCGVAQDSPLSCERYLHELVLNPLQFPEDQFICFLPDSDDFNEECIKVHRALQQNPIDLCVLGLGRNGHLGLNEPNVYLKPYAHVAELSDKTKSHNMIKGSTLTQGMTIGMQEIMASKKVLLQVSGEDKEAIFAQLNKGEIDPMYPASFLWMHPNVEVHIRADQFIQS